MSCRLILGDRTYSSWSPRIWLPVDRFGLPVRTGFLSFAAAPVAQQVADHAPARTVPLLLTPDGPVWDSLAIAEELAQRFSADLWPAAPAGRAMARSLAAEMHAGFAALRQHCPMNLRRACADMPVPAAVADDLARIDAIWCHALARCGGGDGWLCGACSVADASFAPVAARIAGYGLPVSPVAAAYMDRRLGEPSFRRWRVAALAETETPARYALPYRQVPWPNHPAAPVNDT